MLVPFIQGEKYSRKDVRDILAPESPFHPSAGLWAPSGLIEVPGQPNNFVFFVTEGVSEAHHTFDEKVTEDGIVIWQSKPAQKVGDKQIGQLIDHDHFKNNIYLFWRQKKRVDYTFYGRLAYLGHDPESSKPVHFEWQIIDWPMPKKYSAGSIVQESPPTYGSSFSPSIEKTTPPQSVVIQSSSKSKRRGVKMDYSKRDKKNQELGGLGELMVLAYEKQQLIDAGKDDLVDQIVHISREEGDGLGYDIKSFNLDGAQKYIEVKTTAGPKNTAFYITHCELEFLIQHKHQAYIYRLYEFDREHNKAKLYVITGEALTKLELQPIQYRISF